MRSQIAMLSSALEAMGSESSVNLEREETAELQSSIPQLPEDDTPATRLARRMHKSLAKLREEIERVDKTIGSSLRVMIDKDRDGFFSREEIEHALKHLKLKLSEVEKSRIVGAIDQDRDGKVSLHDLRKMASTDDDVKEQHKQL